MDFIRDVHFLVLNGNYSRTGCLKNKVRLLPMGADSCRRDLAGPSKKLSVTGRDLSVKEGIKSAQFER